MPSSTLKKALEGDEYSLILMTELIQFKKITAEDVSYIRHSAASNKSSNPNNDYLFACCECFGIGKDADLKNAKDILKSLAAKGNGFASNLLAHIYREAFRHDSSIILDNTNKYLHYENKYSKSAINVNNPLGLLNQLIHSENTLEAIFDTAPIIYHRLSTGYQRELLEYIQAQYKKIDTAKDYYKFARCFEKMKLLPQMYEAFHKACELNQSEYQRKFVKTLEKQANANGWGLFKTEFDYSYINNQLSNLNNKLVSLDKKIASCKVGNQKEMSESIEKLKEIGLALKNYYYIIQEKSPAFKPEEQAALSNQLVKLADFYKVLRPQWKGDVSLLGEKWEPTIKMS